MQYTDQFPVLNNAQGLYFYAWVLVTLSLVLTKLLKVEFLVFHQSHRLLNGGDPHIYSNGSAVGGAFGQARVRALDHPHYNGDSFVRGIFIVLCLFRAVSFQYRLLKKKKWGNGS